ncbi:hypothetical protein ERJ75_000192300 [Trypanosoma vivax]|uniref:S1-like domain-containing protein n=1 Tax=Trypanosoma vivax (strain Y486) TaxID=1055687 RepID=G0UA54_TRYVY|nr:hypothetical protein TRVL_05183 [Trypanosoma vivax]KAH8618983.1 hypothetical protein ERJ75_000192300 [Trypanosoma vivax]CCC52686.1 conserved hypothetical protein [Trypanosoma vivax Y486]
MSGCGRKHRAKHLTQKFLDASGWTCPSIGEQMAVCTESPQGQHVRVLLVPPPGGEDATVEAAMEERLVFIPGKFRKVIWLVVRDVVVVADGTTVTFKPSPEQLKQFFREYPSWKALLDVALDRVKDFRRSMEQQPRYAKPVTTTTSLLPVVAGPQLAVNTEETDELVGLNPNRNNIHHRVQLFYVEDDQGDEVDSSEEEEEEEEQEERTEATGEVGDAMV